MSISSGVGLISGINTASIVDSLIAVEGRPRDLLKNRIAGLNTQKSALLDLSAAITAMLARFSVLSSRDTFRSVSATSSAPGILNATVDTGAQAGSYNFVVRSLAATQQMISRGFADSNSPLSNGTISIESAAARVNRSTQLSELNGYHGVHRGDLEITDRNGKRATISIAEATTLDEVAAAINSGEAGVRASVVESGLRIEDTSGGSGTLRIRSASGGSTAADLGFNDDNDSSSSGVLVSESLIRLSEQTPLSALNDSLGVRHGAGGGDFAVVAATGDSFRVDLSGILKADVRLSRLNHGTGVRSGVIRIQRHDGKIANVDLTQAATVNDVKSAIEGAFEDKKVSVILNGSRFIVTDSTTGDNKSLTIDDVSGFAARDLGIASSSTTTQIGGRDVLDISTVSDILAAVNSASGNQSGSGPLVRTQLGPDGHSFQLVDLTQGSGQVELRAVDGSPSHALEDLGLSIGVYGSGGSTITGSGVLSGANTVMLKTLNGGHGVTAGTVQVDVDGVSTSIDLSGARTLAAALESMNAALKSNGIAATASLDATSTRVVVSRTDGNSGEIRISDVSGTFAKQLGLSDSGGTTIRSVNLQRQYISEATKLSELNSGQGVPAGKFKITNRNGIGFDIDVSGAKTIGDVITAINDRGFGVTAGINDTGDGLLLTDSTGGTGALTVAESGGTTARDLNLLGTATDNVLDASYELKLDVTGSDTPQSVVDRINARTRLATATLFNDGSGSAAWRITLSSRASGLAGAFIIDPGDTGAGFSSLLDAKDARILVGSDSRSSIPVTSSSNTFKNVVRGMTLNISGISDTPVSVVVKSDSSGLVAAINGFVSDFNAVIDKSHTLGKYDSKSQTSGPLLGDNTLQSVQERLYRLVRTGGNKANTVVRGLADLGLSFADGGKLSLDTEKLQAAIDRSPDDVAAFFTKDTTGFAAVLKTQVESLTKDKGLIPSRTTSLTNQAEQLNSRIEQLTAQLNSKRARLMAQFQAMESSLSALQSQQSSLSAFGSISFSSK